MNHYEIETCVIGAKNGNKDELLKVLNQYKPFIFKTARNYNIRNHDINDLEQIGYMALIKALDKSMAGSCTFSTYAYESIKNAFRYTARQNSKHDKALSLNSTSDSYGTAIDYLNFIPSPENLEESVLDSEQAFEVKRAIAKLPIQEQELVMTVYYKGNTLKGYAQKHGMSYYEAYKKKDMVLSKLGRQFKQ